MAEAAIRWETMAVMEQSYVDAAGRRWHLRYTACDGFEALDRTRVHQVYGVCFTADGDVVLGHDGRGYVLPGGKPEPGEDYPQTLAREVPEETNMAVLHAVPIGFVHVRENDEYQLRYVCRVVPLGPFEADPAGQVLSVRAAAPGAAVDLLAWGRIGRALLQRAQQLILGAPGG